VWEGVRSPPIAIETKVIILEHADGEVHPRALALFTGKAKRAVGLRGELSIRITSDAEMRELNRRFRRKNKPTDVLSFPAEGPELAGDIAISAEIAAANAAKLGHSLDIELKVLILHGLLHLAGYDHESDGGEMLAQETRLREKLKLPTGLIERANGGSPRTPRRTTTAARQGRRR
jgi:probable rRNA maturation factor